MKSFTNTLNWNCSSIEPRGAPSVNIFQERRQFEILILFTIIQAIKRFYACG